MSIFGLFFVDKSGRVWGVRALSFYTANKRPDKWPVDKNHYVYCILLVPMARHNQATENPPLASQFGRPKTRQRNNTPT